VLDDLLARGMEAGKHTVDLLSSLVPIRMAVRGIYSVAMRSDTSWIVKFSDYAAESGVCKFLFYPPKWR
jgi:hypothetical protein